MRAVLTRVESSPALVELSIRQAELDPVDETLDPLLPPEGGAAFIPEAEEQRDLQGELGNMEQVRIRALAEALNLYPPRRLDRMPFH